MIYKSFDGMGGDTSFLDVTTNGLNKIASLGTHIPDKLAWTIQEIERNPEPGHAYLYDRALGAGETYGANNNGDWFGRQALIDHHESFEKHAHLFRHHQSRDPANAIGSVEAAAFNEPLDCVDLIVKAPIEKIANDLNTFEGGGAIQTSMGAKVPYDECSVCGNQAKTRMMYCTHLKTMMLKVLPDGRQVFARNPIPRFVDISIVVIPADPASTVLRKIASLTGDNHWKPAAMKKHDVGSNTEYREPINPDVIEATEPMDRASALQTIHAAVGALRPDEFQAILRKDASCIRPDIVPYVPYRAVESAMMFGQPHYKMASLIAQAPTQPLFKSARLAPADFLDPEERYMYLQYRQSMAYDTTDFLR